MADNLAWTPGTGATIRTQDKGGAHVQAVQVDVGNDSTVTPLVLGQATTANSVPVALASDATLPVTNAGTFAVQVSRGPIPATGTSTQVASSASLVTILASNASRLGASVYNDDANVLYLLLGAGTVTSSVYTVQVPSSGYFEVPYGFTGILTGLWAADGSGSARVTEIT